MRAQAHPRQIERLRALNRYNILDTSREQDFDEIVALASRICEAPISVVNLIDKDRQWFKAEVGLNARETPLETSICSHIILQDDFVEIPDTLADGRMADNPLCLDEPGLRFYAGAPLIASNGLPIGTLCVLDHKPRQLNELQRETLRVLSRQVMKQIELRLALQTEKELRAEMDHRVKNSLQATSSLVRMYGRGSEGQTADVFGAIQRRIDSMSALHEQLQRGHADDMVDISEYINRLCTLLTETAPEGIRVTGTSDPLLLSSDAASNIGVILSEFAANAIKHGYPEGENGTITVSLRRTDDGNIRLTASDDGVGSHRTKAEKTPTSGIGTRLVAAAAAKLHGTLSHEIGPDGARLTLDFS